jgi:hydrogenase maturation factor
MGLSSPARVLSIESGTGVVDVRGARRRVRLALLTAAGRRIDVGDRPLVQLGLAVAWLDADEAVDLIRLIDDAARPVPAAA